MYLVIFFILFLNSRYPLLKCDCDLKKFKESIVPAIVPEVPPQELEIVYAGQPVTCGQDVDISITKKIPIVKYEAPSVDFYTLIMIDPDAPDPHRPVFAQFLQWLVVNIPGNQVSKGKSLKDYIPPSPPPYSAPHRYIFLVFRQHEYFFGTTYMLGKGRSRFSIADMLKELHFTDLVAGNFFYTRSEVFLQY